MTGLEGLTWFGDYGQLGNEWLHFLSTGREQRRLIGYLENTGRGARVHSLAHKEVSLG